MNSALQTRVDDTPCAIDPEQSSPEPALPLPQNRATRSMDYRYQNALRASDIEQGGNFFVRFPHDDFRVIRAEYLPSPGYGACSIGWTERLFGRAPRLQPLEDVKGASS